MCCCFKTKLTKCKVCGYLSLSMGVILIAFGIAWPLIMTPLVIAGAKLSAAL